jgi:hypothetical protein
MRSVGAGAECFRGLALIALRIIAKAAAPRCGGKAPQLVSATR